MPRSCKIVDDASLHVLKTQGQALCIAFSPDGAFLAAGSSDGAVHLWRVADGALLCTLEGHMGWVNSIAFSPDGAFLASGSTSGAVRLWRVAGGTPLCTLEGHEGWVRCVSFSPNGELLASASDDCTVRLWRVVLSPEDTLPSLGTRQPHGPDQDSRDKEEECPDPAKSWTTPHSTS